MTTCVRPSAPPLAVCVAGEKVGPILPTTRKLLENKYIALLDTPVAPKKTPSMSKPAKLQTSPPARRRINIKRLSSPSPERRPVDPDSSRLSSPPPETRPVDNGRDGPLNVVPVVEDQSIVSQAVFYILITVGLAIAFYYYSVSPRCGSRCFANSRPALAWNDSPVRTCLSPSLQPNPVAYAALRNRGAQAPIQALLASDTASRKALDGPQ